MSSVVEYKFANKLNHPISEIRHRAFDNVINKLKRGFLTSKCLSEVIDIVISNLQTERCNEMLEFLLRISMDANGRSELLRNNIIGNLLSLMSKPDLKESRTLIQEIISNITSEQHTEINNGSSSRGDLTPVSEAFQFPTNFVEISNIHSSVGNMPNKFITKEFYSFHSADFVIENLPSASISQVEDQRISEYVRSIANTTDLTILSRLGYFDSIILTDYPAEFFLRNPAFIQLLAAFIVTSSSSRVQIASANILNNLCGKLLARVFYFENPNNYSPIYKHVESIETSEINQYLKEFLASASVSKYLRGSLLPPSVINLPPSGVSIPVFAVTLASTALSGLITFRSNMAFRSSLLRLLNKAVDLFLHCAKVDLTQKLVEFTTLESFEPISESVLPSRNLTPGFDNMLELWGILLSTFSKSWRNDLNADCQSVDFEQPRCVYIGLLRPLFRLLFSLWTPEACACLLPTVMSFEIALASLDCHFISNATGNNSTGLSAYVRFLDPEIFLLYSKLMQISRVISTSVDFIRNLEDNQNSDLANLGGLMTKSIDGLGVIEFIPNSYVPKFVSFMAEILLYTDEPTSISLLSQSRPYLLMLLSHRNSDIRKVTYDKIHEILSTSISVENAADPTSQDYKRIMFLLNREVFGEMVEFGVNDTVPEVAATAKACLRILLDSHHLIPESMWFDIVNLIYEQPSDLNSLPYSTEWRPIQPLISLLAGLSAEIDPALGACLGLGGFKNVSMDRLATIIPLLYQPQPYIRRKAASLVVQMMDFKIKGCVELYSPLDETLSDLLFITDPAMPINESIFEELSCKISAGDTSSTNNDLKIFVETMELVGDEIADLGVRCNATERVFGTLNLPYGLDLWHEANGLSILLEWVTSLPAKLGSNVVENLLIEPLVKVFLAITHYVIVNDLKSRHYFYLNQSVFFKSLLQVGLCFWKDSRIRRSVSVIIALIICTPAIRISDESSICLPPAIITSFCLPFTCPFYSIQSRNPIELPDLSCLLQHVANVNKPRSSQRDRALNVAVVRALRVIWKSFAEGIEDKLVLDPVLLMTRTESALLGSANPTITVPNILNRLRTSSSHTEAISSLNYLTLLKVAFMRTPEISSVFTSNHPLWWQEANLQRFLRVLPSCTEDYRLLIQCLQTFITFELSPPFLNPHSLEACALLLGEIVTPNSALVYMMRKFDAGIGSTDSPRLIEAKQSLHFNVIPSLFDAVLACQDYLRDSEHLLKEEQSSNKAERNLRQSDSFEALHFLFQWALKFVKVHTNSLNDHLAYLYSAVKILLRITQRSSWIFGVQRTESVFTELCQLIRRLIQKILELQQSSPHNGFLYSLLELSHNTMLLLTFQNWKKSGESLETSGLAPLVVELISKNANSEVRFLSITILAQLVSYPCAIQIRFCDLWHMAFTVFTSSAESPKMKSAAVHLLTNLIASISRYQSPNGYLNPSYTDPQTGKQIVGPGALKYMLEQYRFFPLLSDMLKNCQPSPIFQCKRRKNSSELIENTGAFSTPLLIDRVCSFLGNLCHILPSDFILQQFEEHKLYEALKGLINPALLDSLASKSSVPSIVGRTAARQIALMFAQILRLFQTILFLSPNPSHQKQVFLLDRRFLVMLANCLTIDVKDMKELLESVMLFFIVLLDSEGDENSPDLVLRHVLQPLASIAHQFVTFLNQLLTEAIEINKTPSNGQEKGSGTRFRSTLFNLLQVALTFISVVLSRPIPQQSSPSDNPVCAAFNNSSTTSQITALLITLATSFPQPIINLDGVLLDSGAARSMLDDECPQIFGQVESHRQAVHSSLKILFCTSMRAKEAALETDFLSTLFIICNNLVDRLNRIMTHPKGSKYTSLATTNSGISAMSIKSPSSSSASDISQSAHSEKQLSEGRQLAWQYLVSQLLCYLEFLGNLFYNSRDVKQAAMQAGFLKLALNIWPLGLIDSRVTHNLLFCLVNLTADSSLLISETSANRSATAQPYLRPAIISHSLSVGGSLMHSLGRLLDSSLVWYNTSSNRGQNATTRPRSDDSNSRNGRCRHRQHNGSLHTWGVDIENIREQILRQIFDLLSNLSWSSEALGFFAKAKILSHFTTLDAKTLARVPKAQYLQRLWLQFITNLTFTREGQALLLNFPGTISVLVDHVRYCRDPGNRHAAYLCLQNLCANTSFKTYLYQRSYGIPELLADTLEPSKNPPEILLQTITALSNAAYNCTKVRAFLKGEGFLHQLNNLKTFCQTNGDGRVRSLLPSVELLITALAQ